MAQGLLKPRFDVHSVGTIKTGVSSMAVEVMAEIGIDITHQK